MKMSTVWSAVGAIIAIIIALWLVNAVFAVAWFLVKALIVVVVAVVIFGVLKRAFASKDS